MKSVLKLSLIFSFLVALLCFSATGIQAQDFVEVKDTTIIIDEPGQFPSNPTFSNVLSWLISDFPRFIGLLISLISVIEIVVRVIPTNSDWSIFNRIIKFLEGIQNFNPFKNNTTRGTVYKTVVKEVPKE